MNSKVIGERIEKILEDGNKDNPICIFIDGEWGIGKTHSIKSIENKYKDNFKYISVFGKSSVDKIEKELILKLYLKKKDIRNGKFKAILDMGNDLIKNNFGLDFNTYIENISIESIDNSNNTIICIDDIERKSNNIDFMELLGLIERISTKFNIIAIGSTNNINDRDELDIFTKFKEKIIDYDFIVDEIDYEVVVSIIKNEIDFLGSNNIKDIVSGFKELEFKNIRILKKYINLISRLNEEIIRVMEEEKFWLDSSLVSACSYVIKSNYMEHEEEQKSRIKKSMIINYKEMYTSIEKILRYENIDDGVIHDYFDRERDINKDIYILRNAYRLSSEDDLQKILDKIKCNINNCNTEYFNKQKDIINLYDTIIELGGINLKNENYYNKLLEIADTLYKPNLKEKPPVYCSDDWNYEHYLYGERENNVVVNIIKDINKINKNIYDEYIKKEIHNAFLGERYQYLKELLSSLDKKVQIDYKQMFSVLFNKLEQEFNDDTWRCLCVVTSIIDDEKYLDTIACKGYICKSRINCLKEVIEENSYFKYQEEMYREYQEEMYRDSEEK